MSTHPVIILAKCHLGERVGYGSPDSLFTESMTALAQKCVGVENPEFLILQDDIASNIVFSSQCFFNNELEEALKKVGIELKVQGSVGGGLPGIVEKIHEKYPDWRPNFSGHGSCSFLLYSVVKE